MKIKQIGNYDGDIISTILKNRKIENIELFLNPNDKNDLDPYKLANMEEGVTVLLAHLAVDSKIGLLVDPDADGFTSSTIIYQTIKKICPDSDITYFLHDTKAHGLTEKAMEQIAKTEINLLIIPDAASNDNDSISRVYYMGVDILIIDHHEVDKYPDFGVLINNQISTNEDTNLNLVGAGMSLKFVQAIDKALGLNIAEEFYDLAAIGQIGDASDISENEIRNLVFKGLNTINNPFVETVLNDFFPDSNNIAPINLSFSIIPLINAVVRVGTLEEKELLFRALNSIDAEETFEVTKKKKNKETGKFDKIVFEMNLYEYTLDVIKKVKARQANMVKKTMAELMTKIDNSGGIAICVLDTSDEGSITGLVANKVASKLRKPTLIVHHIEGKYVGSGRGYEKVLPSLKDWCQETELVEFAQGHANAFGISIFEKDFEAFKEKLKDVKKQEFIYEVDLLTDGKVNKQAILDVDEHMYLFGGKVYSPLFAFTNIKVNKSFIRQKGSMLTFYENGVEFVMYDAPEGLFEELTYNFDRFITMDFVGRPNVSNWNGRKSVQLILEDCERVQSLEKEEEITVENIVF